MLILNTLVTNLLNLYSAVQNDKAIQDLSQNHFDAERSFPKGEAAPASKVVLAQKIASIYRLQLPNLGLSKFGVDLSSSYIRSIACFHEEDPHNSQVLQKC